MLEKPRTFTQFLSPIQLSVPPIHLTNSPKWRDFTLTTRGWPLEMETEMDSSIQWIPSKQFNQLIHRRWNRIAPAQFLHPLSSKVTTSVVSSTNGCSFSSPNLCTRMHALTINFLHLHTFLWVPYSRPLQSLIPSIYFDLIERTVPLMDLPHAIPPRVIVPLHTARV